MVILTSICYQIVFWYCFKIIKSFYLKVYTKCTQFNKQEIGIRKILLSILRHNYLFLFQLCAYKFHKKKQLHKIYTNLRIEKKYLFEKKTIKYFRTFLTVWAPLQILRRYFVLTSETIPIFSSSACGKSAEFHISRRK